MEPQVRYARTSDGVSIAYSVAGGGPATPFVWLPGPPFGHSQLSWGLPPWRARFESLASDRPFVFVDFRGMGMSDRRVDDPSLEALICDLSAVVDQLELERFDLHAIGQSGFAAITYAERNPERIEHLVLRSAYANVRSALGDNAYDPRLRTLRLLLESDWDMYTVALAQLLYGWAPDARDIAAVFRESTTQEFALAFLNAMSRIDVTDLLPRVCAPTLVIHRRDNPFSSIEASRFLASRISGARIAVFEGAWETVDDAPEELRIMREFLGDAPRAALSQSEGLGSGTAVILFTDVVDSTALTERMGDAVYRTLSRSVDERVREAMRAQNGTVVEGKVLGDGVMGVFTYAAQAIAAARGCVDIGRELPMHIGLHAGDVTHEAGNVYGGTVNIASRICGLSAPGEILVSDVVRGMARTSAGVVFEDRGEREMKGVGEAVRVYAVRTED
jgi:class 3 adenylate cyclase